MPYIPLKNGQSVFIQDEDKAQQRYQQEWGGGTSQPQQVVAAPKPQAKPKAQAKPAPKPKQQRGFDLGRFIQQAGGEAVETVKGALKSGAINFLAGPAAPLVQLARPAQQVGQTKIPGTKATVGGELTRVAGEAGRQVVNAPAAALEQIGALTQGVDLGSALAGGPMGAGSIAPMMENQQLAEQRQKNAAAALEALQKTGRTPEGFSYGIKPSTPLLGPIFSEDSEFVREVVKPKTALGQMAASMAAAMAFDKGVSSIIKAPAMTAKTGLVLDDIWKAKDIKNGLKIAANFIVKDLIPDAIQGSMFYQPELPTNLRKKLDAAQKLQTPEQRILQSKAARASSQEEFDYFYGQLIETVAGTGTLVGLRSGFWAVNRFFNKVSKNIPATKAIEEAIEEAFPLAKQEIQAEGLAKAYEQREDRLGTVTADLYRKIDENVGKIAESARNGAETFLSKQQEAALETENLINKIDEGFAVTPESAQELDAAISKLQGDFSVKTPEEIQAKRTNLQARLDEYERVMTEDPEWIKRSTGTGKRASKNSSKVRAVVNALEGLNQLDNLVAQRAQVEQAQLAQIERFAELGRVTESSFDASIGFKNALTDARILVDALDELDAERISLLTARNNQLFAENRIDEVNTDFSLNDAFGEAYGELKDILNTAEAAVASENLNPDFMRTFVQRVEEIQNKVIDNGGLAPTVPEMPEGLQMPPVEAVDEAVTIPRQEPPVRNEVPVTVDEAGEIKIDTDEIAVRRVANETFDNQIAESDDDIVKAINKDRDQFQNPSETRETLDEWVRGFEKTLAKQKELAELDAKNGTNLVEEATEMFNSNAIKFTASLEDAAAVKAGLSFLNERDPNLLKKQYEIAIGKMATTFGEDGMWRRMQQLIEAEKFGENTKQGLQHVIIASSYLSDSAINALKASRDYKAIINDPNASAADRVTVLTNFRNNFQLLLQNLKAIDAQFEGIGNALRLFADSNQLEYSSEDSKVLFGEFNRQLAGVGDFTEEISESAKAAKDELNETLSSLFNKKEFSEEDFDNITTLVDRLYQTKGDLSKLKDLEITASAVLAGVQSGGMISNPATAGSIPIQGFVNYGLRVMGLTASGTLSAATKEFLMRDPTVTAQLVRRVELEQKTILNLRHFFGLALRNTFNSFVFGRSIADPTQAREAASELPKTLGLTREQSIIDDLAKTEIKIPFTNYVYERSEGNDKIFDTLNKSRVLAKVFHDYAIAGDRQQYRSVFGKWILSPTSTVISKVQRMAGGGTASYYPGGEYVNMSLPFRLSAAGDELITSWFANARVQAEVETNVDAMISMGVLNLNDRKAKIKELRDAAFKEMYQPVKVGIDQQVIGNSIRDKQFMEFMQVINQTSELTGGLKDIKNGINQWRYSDNPVLAAFSNHLAGVVTSPLNSLKQFVMIAGGGEIVQAGSDVARLGYKNVGNALITALTPKDRQKLIEFESKYFSSDPEVQFQARGALALAIGLQAAVFFLVRDGNQDITGGLENSYREGVGKVDMFTWKVGNYRVPYRFIPFLGDVIGVHATLRDMDQFGNTRGSNEMIALSTGILANWILEAPGLAGMDRAVKLLDSVAQGNIDKLAKEISGFVAGGGDPYIYLRKVMLEGIDPRKAASPTTRFMSKGWWSRKQQKVAGINAADFMQGLSTSTLDTVFNTFGLTTEYSPLRPLVDRFVALVKNEPEARSRKALWYGKPGEVVSANHAGVWYPLQAVLGRYWVFPDKLGSDEVANEIVTNLIQPPKPGDFHKYGLSVSETIVNDFNHFFSSEFLYTDPLTGKQHKGVNSYLKDFIKTPLYQSLPKTDSPFKMPTLDNPANWDRSENPRRKALTQEVRMLKEKAITQFIDGTNPGQRYKAPLEMKQFIEQQRMTGGAQ